MTLREDTDTVFGAGAFRQSDGTLSNSTVLVVDPAPDIKTIAGTDRANRVTLLCEPTAEAGMRHVDAERIDCLVSECDAIGVEALDFLSLILDVTPELPVIFYTKQDSALARSRLLKAGAAEYCVKTTDPDMRAHIGASIRRWALAYHHQCSTKPRIKDYEQFGKLTGNTFAAHDLRTGRNVQIGNLRELSYDVEGESWNIQEIFQLLHPADVDHVMEKNAAVLQLYPDAFDELTEKFGQFSEVIRLQRTDGSYAPFLMRGILLIENGAPSVMFNTVTSISDDIKRQWRESASEVLLSTASVQSAAARVCQTLCGGRDCQGAWVVSTASQHAELDVLAVRGSSTFAPEPNESSVQDPATSHLVEQIRAPAVDRKSSTSNTEGDAGGQRMHTEEVPIGSETVYITSVTLTHAKVTYGTVTVEQSTPPTDLFLEGLCSMAASLAYRYSIETQEKALTSDVVTRVELSTEQVRVFSALSSVPELAATPLDLTPIDNGLGPTSKYLVSVNSAEVSQNELAEKANTCDNVARVDMVANTGSVSMITVEVESPTLASNIRAHAGVIQELKASSGMVTLVVDLPRHTPVSQFIKQMRDSHPDVRLLTKEQVDTDKRLPLVVDALTEKQYRALEVATQAGFFDRPQMATADDVADLLSVSRTTALRHIRSAERKLISAVFERGGRSNQNVTR
jgi:predicted DNA binding protein/DNA-binding response OmpR family regulator